MGRLAAMTDQSFAPPSAGAPPTTAATTTARAGFWIRFGAALIDGILISIVTVPLQLGLNGTGYALSLLVGIAYYTYCEGGERGQTIGKAALTVSANGQTKTIPVSFAGHYSRFTDMPRT